ncbi:hypothetical protein AXG93_3016s1300 [Marchantia polymorpha subsp. ruderalis]|uniref:Uncharacterized protein n=1 Tax=Marchantia polymorpha subsp. ruderalis TaxID=1480154 RepID=A0A176WET2_MARPO|nr:hypothetical protein AXG93_3016s1300 [Marchantia polymorpha subsp. ruderalis]
MTPDSEPKPRHHHHLRSRVTVGYKPNLPQQNWSHLRAPVGDYMNSSCASHESAKRAKSSYILLKWWTNNPPKLFLRPRGSRWIGRMLFQERGREGGRGEDEKQISQQSEEYWGNYTAKKSAATERMELDAIWQLMPIGITCKGFTDDPNEAQANGEAGTPENMETCDQQHEKSP